MSDINETLRGIQIKTDVSEILKETEQKVVEKRKSLRETLPEKLTKIVNDKVKNEDLVDTLAVVRMYAKYDELAKEFIESIKILQEHPLANLKILILNLQSCAEKTITGKVQGAYRQQKKNKVQKQLKTYNLCQQFLLKRFSQTIKEIFVSDKRFPDNINYETSQLAKHTRHGPYRSTPAQIAASLGIYIPDRFLHDKYLEEELTGKTAYLLAYEFDKLNILREEMKYESTKHLCLVLYEKAVKELKSYGFKDVEEQYKFHMLIYFDRQFQLLLNSYRSKHFAAHSIYI